MRRRRKIYIDNTVEIPKSVFCDYLSAECCAFLHTMIKICQNYVFLSKMMLKFDHLSSPSPHLIQLWPILPAKLILD